ncbi:MAG: hypothetical protein WC314_00820 [Vulcanimicrobiota bacterium]
MLENLLADRFAGFVQLRLAGGVSGFFILRDGNILRALEATSRSPLTARLPARIYGLMHQKPTAEVSVYVLAESMVSIYCSSFAFNTIMADKKIERKELKRVISNLEDKRQTGFMRVAGPKGLVHLLFDEGDFVIERFAESFGEIVCGPAQVSAVLDYVHENGSRVLIRAAEAAEVAKQTDAVNDDLGRIRQLTLKKASALFRSAEEVKLSEEVLRDWGLDAKSQFEVELETADGRMHKYKCRSGSSRLGNRVEVHSNMLKDMNVDDGDLVNIRPIL